jgi:hypothetical protein
MCKTPEMARAALAIATKTGSCENTYGSILVPGTVITADHHVPWLRECRSPCVSVPNADLKLDLIGVSHFDWDCLGGVLAMQGRKPNNCNWDLVEFIDLNGPHRLHQFEGASERNIAICNAFWSWSQKNRTPFIKPFEAWDATEFFKKAEEALLAILAEDAELLGAGYQFEHDMKTLSRSSLVEHVDGVMIRKTTGPFVNALYNNLETGKIAKAVVGYNEKMGTITLSFEEGDSQPLSAVEIMQELYGKESGGHHGIAGSPRSGGLTMKDAERLSSIIRERLV